MLLNEGKCQFLIIESARSSRNDVAKIQIPNKIIEESKKAKLLGITFDNNITMSKCIKNIRKQASNKLYALARIYRYLNEHKRRMCMKSFIISQFDYCLIIWMYCQRKSNNLIKKIHERALRIAYDVSDFDSLLEKDESVTIHQRNIQVLALEIYKTQKDLNPKFMKEIFSVKKHNYPMRKQPLEYPNPCTVTYGLEYSGTKPLKYGILYPVIFKKLITYVLSKASPQNTAKRYVNATYAKFM